MVESPKVQGARSIARKAERLKAENPKISRVSKFFSRHSLKRVLSSLNVTYVESPFSLSEVASRGDGGCKRNVVSLERRTHPLVRTIIV